MKKHTELVSSSNDQYRVRMGGTRDGFNTADCIETYGGAMRYTNLPGSFAPSIEERIVDKVHEMVDSARTAASE